MRRTKLSGGSYKPIDRTTLLTFLFLLLVIHAILAILMVTNVIQFADSQTQFAVTIVLSLAGFLVLLYILFIVTAVDDGQTSKYLAELLDKINQQTSEQQL